MKMSRDNIIWLYLILFGHSIGFKKCICFEMLSNAFEDPIKRWCRAYYYPKSIMLISTNLWGLFVHLFINTGKLRLIKVNQVQLRSIWSWSALKKAQVQNWEKQRVSLTSTVRWIYAGVIIMFLCRIAKIVNPFVSHWLFNF